MVGIFLWLLEKHREAAAFPGWQYKQYMCVLLLLGSQERNTDRKCSIGDRNKPKNSSRIVRVKPRKRFPPGFNMHCSSRYCTTVVQCCHGRPNVQSLLEEFVVISLVPFTSHICDETIIAFDRTRIHVIIRVIASNYTYCTVPCGGRVGFSFLFYPSKKEN